MGMEPVFPHENIPLMQERKTQMHLEKQDWIHIFQIIALLVLVCSVVCWPRTVWLLIILIDKAVLRFHNERPKVSDDCVLCRNISGFDTQLLPGEREAATKWNVAFGEVEV